MFRQRLKALREESGLTLDELAEKYNKRFDGKLNKGTLSKYENGRQEPMINVVNNLASLFSVSVDYLLGNVNDPSFFLDNDRIIASINSYEDNDSAYHRNVTDEELKFALFGGEKGITDEDLAEVKAFAEFVKNKRKK